MKLQIHDTSAMTQPAHYHQLLPTLNYILPLTEHCLSVCLTLFIKPRSFSSCNFIHTSTMMHPAHCHWPFFTLTYFQGFETGTLGIRSLVAGPNEQKTLLALWRWHFCNRRGSCSECLSWWVLSRFRGWVAWEKKLGHWAKWLPGAGLIFPIYLYIKL